MDCEITINDSYESDIELMNRALNKLSAPLELESETGSLDSIELIPYVVFDPARVMNIVPAVMSEKELLDTEKFAQESYKEYWEKYGRYHSRKQIPDSDNA